MAPLAGLGGSEEILKRPQVLQLISGIIWEQNTLLLHLYKHHYETEATKSVSVWDHSAKHLFLGICKFFFFPADILLKPSSAATFMQKYV